MPEFEDAPKPSFVQKAQQQAFVRADVAATTRAFQDLDSRVAKLSDSIFQLAATAPNCSKEAFEEAWKKREELNQVHHDLANLESKIKSCMPPSSTARLTPQERQQIKGFYQTGLYTQQQLAEQYGVTQPTIGDIVRG